MGMTQTQVLVYDTQRSIAATLLGYDSQVPL